MKANLLKNICVLCLTFIHVFYYSTVFAKSSGGAIAGGGGDSYEKRVDDIRNDILSWINKGGSAGLEFGASLSNEDYISKMSTILAPKYVVVNFVENDDQGDDELQVTVSGMPKTCRGFLSRKDNRPHILCDLNRFKKTTESDQYRLIHHEYAGLIGVERNDGASSDYFISSQLTSYLQRQSVLKLSIKKRSEIANRLVPFVELKKSKYIKEGFYEVTFVARNMRDTSELKLIPFQDTSWDRCNLPVTPLVFSEEILEHTVYVGGKPCQVIDRPAIFEEGIVEYKDGIIKTLGRQIVDYVDVDLKSSGKNTGIKINKEVVKEVKGEIISFHGNKLKTIRKTIKFTFNTTPEQIQNTRVVIFGKGDELVTDDSQEMASFINSKVMYYDFEYVQVTREKGSLCLDACYFVREIIMKGYTRKNIFYEDKTEGQDFVLTFSNDLQPVVRFESLTNVDYYVIK